jgi:hypothetical protein
MSCPYTSQQNGKAECILRTLNNITRSLLFQASLPSSYWVEALHTATYLLNRRPSKTLAQQTLYAILHGSPPSYNHLRVFRCKCYPNMSTTTTHKLSPRSSLCVFLGYSENHKGYRFLDLASNHLIISHHVVFDESSFSFAAKSNPLPSSDFDFLSEFNASLPIRPCSHSHVCAGTISSDVGVAPSVPIAPALLHVHGLSSHLPRRCLCSVTSLTPSHPVRSPPRLLPHAPTPARTCPNRSGWWPLGLARH